MALLEVSFPSKALGERTRLNILLPEPRGRKVSPREIPVIYLLHGYSGNESDWLLKTNICLLSSIHEFVAILPYGGRSFYADLPIGSYFETYITEEIPELLADWFCIEQSRDKTAIAGNSMGAFGALRLALNHPEKYAAVGAFSGPLDARFFEQAKDLDPASYEAGMLALGNPETVVGGEHDPEIWLADYIEKIESGSTPQLDIAAYCGTEDFLVDMNRSYAAKARRAGLDLPLFLAPGGHDFFYWQKALDQWLDRIFDEVLPSE
jgi:putative tributyrin esterase